MLLNLTLHVQSLCRTKCHLINVTHRFSAFFQSLEIREAKLGAENLQVASTLYELGVCAWRQEDAEEFLERSLAIREAKLDPEDLLVADTLQELGRCVLEVRICRNK